MEWKEVRLGDVCDIFAGGDAPKGNMSKTITCKYNIPIYSNGITNEGLYGYTDKARVFEPASTITARGTIGVVFRRRKPYFPIVRLISVIGNKEIIDSDFLYYSLKNTYIDGEGSVQAQLTVPMISNYRINLPSLPTQQAIASILSSLDEKIETNRKICANLEAQAQALFKHWFIDFAPFKDGKFVESELGRIPEGWRVGKIQDLASKMASGGTPTSTNRDYYGGNILWYSTKELTDNFLLESEKHITQVGLENSSAKLFPKDTVLMAIYAAPTVGRLGILTQEASFNQAAVGIVAKEEVGYEYIYSLLLFERKNLNNLACGAAQQNLNVGIVKNYKCVIPTRQGLATFREQIIGIFLQIKKLQQESSRLSSLRDTLLPKLMSGQIKV